MRRPEREIPDTPRVFPSRGNCCGTPFVGKGRWIDRVVVRSSNVPAANDLGGVAGHVDGEFMNVRLRQDDAAAVDLLLDRAVSARGNGNGAGGDGNGGHVTFAAGSHAGVSNDRLAAVERVLHVLDAMPQTEPSPDLLQRTLQRVDAGAASPMRQTAPTLIDASRPHA